MAKEAKEVHACILGISFAWRMHSYIQLRDIFYLDLIGMLGMLGMLGILGILEGKLHVIVPETVLACKQLGKMTECV
jgi:hypothetical protein